MFGGPQIRRTPRRAIVALALTITSVVAGTVRADERIRFRRFSVEDGLPNTTVEAILQDHQGFLWVGTNDGLSLFDGYRFETFRHDPEDPLSLPSNPTLALLEDHSGRLWMGTGAGLAYYDRAQRAFHLVPLPKPPDAETGLTSIDPDDPLAEPAIRVLFEDRRRRLWIGTGHGLFRLSTDLEAPQASDVRPGFEGLIPGTPELPDPRVNALVEDPNGSLWIGTRGGLLRLSSERQLHRLDHFTHDADDPTTLHDDELYTLLVDSRGDLWLGTWGGGGLAHLPADQLLEDTPRFKRFDYPVGDPRAVGHGIVQSLLEADDGTLWIGSQRSGLWLLSPEERQRPEPHFRNILHDPLDDKSLPLGALITLARDDQGGIWTGSVQGTLAYHVPATASVALHSPHPKPGDPFTVGRRFSLWEAKDGTLWSSTVQGVDRIRILDGSEGTFAVERFSHDPADPHSLASNRVYTIYEDSRERLWVGTISGGLDRFEDGPKPRFIHHGKEQGLENLAVFALFEDASGVLWVGTYQGLFRLDETPGEPPSFTAYHHVRDDPKTLSSSVIYALTEDADGRLWIGTDQGLDRLEQDRKTLVRHVLGQELDLHQLIFAEGFLWAATGFRGVLRIDPDTGEMRSWKRTDGLSSDYCQAVALDASGRVWAAMAGRMHQLDPTTGEIRIFTRRDGFDTAPYLPGALHRGHSGRFYVGGNDGFAMFRPEELSHPPLLAPVVLRGLQLANEPVSVGSEGPLPQSIDTLSGDGPGIVLQPEHRTFSFEFAALTFHRQELVRYAHRLRGYSDDWIETDADLRQATFTNLSPGTYTFEVRARSDVGSWSPQSARLTVQILPHWYQSRLFRAVALLTLIGIPALWTWSRFRRLEAHRRELQELVDRWRLERRQRRRWQDLSVAASQLAHRLEAPLTAIRRASRWLLDSDKLSDEARGRIHGILEESQQTHQRLTEFLAFAEWRHPEPRPVDLGKLIDDTLATLDTQIAEKGIPVRQEVRGVTVVADASMVSQMLLEVVSNSLEASHPGDLLQFSFDDDGTTGNLRIEDHGSGISREVLTEVTKPYFTDKAEGRGLGLTMVEHLAEQQDWTLGISSEEGRGTRIELTGLRLEGKD